MTMPMDLFAPATPGDAGDPQSAAAEWTQALNDPKVRASMLTIGLQLMQPPQFGQTFGGQLAQGIGQAGEMFSRQDEEDRAEREQARKERDTASNIDYRAEGAESRTTLANAATLRAEAAVQSANTRDILAQSQVALNASRARELEAKVQALELKTQLYPQDQAAKIELSRARTDLATAQAGLARERTTAVAPVAASQVTRNEAAANLSNTRAAGVNVSQELARRRLEQGDRRISTQELIARQRLEQQDKRDYTTEKTKAQEVHRKEQGMLPRARQTPFTFPPYEEWTAARARGEVPAQPAASPAPAPAPAPATTPALAPAPAATPSVNVQDETMKAARALSQAKDEATKQRIRALYKQRTGQDLP